MTDTPALLLLGLRFLLAASLYAFLGGVIVLIWQELKHTGSSEATRRIPTITLEAIGQPAPAPRLTFSEPSILIGRDPICSYRMDLDTVSTQHARLRYQNEQWWLEDLGSRNGTFLNAVQIEGPVVLADQDKIQCGEAILILHLEHLSDGAPA